MIYIGLKRGTGFYSMLIRTWTRSKYSHAMVVVEHFIFDDEAKKWVWEEGSYDVYEATAKQGTIVRRATLEQLKSEGVDLYRYTKFFNPLPATFDGIKDFLVRLESQVGTGYDWTAIFYSRVFNIDRQDAKKWFCFEFVAEVFGMQKAWRWTGRTFQDKLEGVI